MSLEFEPRPLTSSRVFSALNYDTNSVCAPGVLPGSLPFQVNVLTIVLWFIILSTVGQQDIIVKLSGVML
jgi:hypothetical protein